MKEKYINVDGEALELFHSISVIMPPTHNVLLKHFKSFFGL